MSIFLERTFSISGECKFVRSESVSLDCWSNNNLIIKSIFCDDCCAKLRSALLTDLTLNICDNLYKSLKFSYDISKLLLLILSKNFLELVSFIWYACKFSSTLEIIALIPVLLCISFWMKPECLHNWWKLTWTVSEFKWIVILSFSSSSSSSGVIWRLKIVWHIIIKFFSQFHWHKN